MPVDVENVDKGYDIPVADPPGEVQDNGRSAGSYTAYCYRNQRDNRTLRGNIDYSTMSLALQIFAGKNQAEK